MDDRSDQDFHLHPHAPSAAGAGAPPGEPDPDPERTILVILHQEHSTPGRVGQFLTARGYALDIRKPRFGDPLPETLENHKAAVIFGGPMSANDPDDYLKREIDWIGVPLSENKPFLGICLGSQMLARHLGGTVEDHPDGIVEIGYYPLSATDSGESMMPWPDCVYQWHKEWMNPPAGTDILAVGPCGAPQAMRVGEKAFGLQFHSELTLAMMHKWTVKGAERMALKGAQPRWQHLEGRLQHDPTTRRWLNAFLDHWLG